MTEKAAWKYLAAKIECAALFPVVTIVDWKIAGLNAQGVCESLGHMVREGVIDRPVYNDMRKRMRSYRHLYPLVGYWWSRDVAGAKERVAFCRRMAKECEVQK